MAKLMRCAEFILGFHFTRINRLVPKAVLGDAMAVEVVAILVLTQLPLIAESQLLHGF
jgi:hypothetical protein